MGQPHCVFPVVPADRPGPLYFSTVGQAHRPAPLFCQHGPVQSAVPLHSGLGRSTAPKSRNSTTMFKGVNCFNHWNRLIDLLTRTRPFDPSSRRPGRGGQGLCAATWHSHHPTPLPYPPPSPIHSHTPSPLVATAQKTYFVLARGAGRASALPGGLAEKWKVDLLAPAPARAGLPYLPRHGSRP